MVLEMNQKEYLSLLNNTHIWSNSSVQEQNASLTPLVEYIHRITPKNLYRFRDCSERSFDAFHRDQIWTSSADVLNDDFDARLFFHLEELKKWIQDQKGIHVIKELEKNYTDTGEIPIFLRELFPAIDKMLQQSKSVPEEIEDQIKKLFLDDCDRYGTNLIQLTQQNSMIACFSTSIHSPLMWGQYANSASGFALAYDFKNSPLFDDDNQFSKQYACELYPVCYSNKRIDATDYAKNFWIHYVMQTVLRITGVPYNHSILLQVLPQIDQFTNRKIALIKSKEWSPEKEWRLFISSKVPSVITSKHLPIPKRPCAIYLGSRISEINEKILCSIAKEKNLPVYRMEIKNNQIDYKLHPVKIKP
jgi:hypothetical protein